MNTLPKRLMVMAGGTGGHIFPALAVAKALRERGTQIVWLGTQRGLESTVIPANNIDIEWVNVAGLRGKGVLSWLLAPVSLMRAMWQSMAAIRRVQPDCVLGMGGFVTGPGGVAARLLGKPLIIHEQNAVAGLTNKYLAKIANCVLTGFPQVEHLSAVAKWVGNPVREGISSSAETISARAKAISSSAKAVSSSAKAIENSGRNTAVAKLLVIGGSQGATAFNNHLPHVFSQLPTAVEVWHQSGRGHSAKVKADYKANHINARVDQFISDMAAAYHWADLLICRAGAMTISECCAAAKPALLIPFPFSAGDHQVKNAQLMVAVGGAKMLRNRDITEAVMVKTLAALLADADGLDAMGRAAASLHKPNALDTVVSICEEYLNAQSS